jgi:hypothetical protein
MVHPLSQVCVRTEIKMRAERKAGKRLAAVERPRAGKVAGGTAET